jgi:hypothetical protein
MLFTHNKTIEDTIIELVLENAITAKKILSFINKNNETYTIQALYVVLRNLIESEVIIKTGFYYKINEEWKNKIQEKFGQINTELLDGEKSVYVMNSLSSSDLHWKNTILPLHKKFPDDPIFFYNYHYIWIHLGKTRENSEIEYYKSFLKQKKNAYCLIGSHSNLEVETKKMIENEYVFVYIDDKPIQSSGYLTIINDYIITTQLPEKVLNEIDACYKKSKTIVELRENLQKINLDTKKAKLIIEHNKEKAKKLRKKMSKDFYIPRELKEKFDLF